MSGLGRAEAEWLLRAGWRQGSVFSPNEWITLPEGEDPDSVFVILTQSCTVVSDRWDRDLLIEYAVAKRVKKYNARSREATGRNNAKLAVAVDAEEYSAIEIDFYKRRFADRATFLNFQPDPVQPEESESRKVGGWMGRIYSRVALPNALVAKLKTGQLTTVSGVLGEHAALREAIDGFFINWEPNDEDGPYEVEIEIITADQESAELIDRAITSFPIVDGVHINVNVRAADTLFVSDIRGKVRLTEFDYFSELDEELLTA